MHYWNSKMFRRLQLSFGVLTFCLLFLTLGIYIHRIIGDMKKEEIRLMQNRIDMVAEDLKQQTQSMQSYVFDVANQGGFNPNNIRKGKYQEIEFLNAMKRYSKVSQIAEYHFINYQYSDIIYTSNGTLMHVDRYFGKKLQMENYSDEKELLRYLCETNEEKQVLHRIDETVLVLYPLQMYCLNTSKRYGVVGFQLTQKELQDRIDVIAGKINGEVVIYYDDFCILGQENIESKGECWISSQSGNYHVYVCIDKEMFFSWGNVFSFQEIAFVGLLILVLLIVIWGLINWNYKPLKKITDKYALTNEMAPDWKHIEEAFDCFIQDREADKKQLNMQYRLLREQIIRRVISGENSEQLQNWMIMLDIKVNGFWYGVIQCVCLDEQKEERSRICEDVEGLSDEVYQLYAYWENDSTLFVFVSSKEEYFYEEISELLQSVMESRLIKCKITVYKRWSSFDRKGTKKREEINTVEKEVSSDYSNRTVKTALEYIRNHCTEYNLTLDVIADETQVTSAHLCRLIKKEVGMNYKEYLTMLRMEEAKRLLQEGEQTVVEISRQVGYMNISYFIKLFQKHTGMTPAIYKEHYQKNAGGYEDAEQY